MKGGIQSGPGGQLARNFMRLEEQLASPSQDFGHSTIEPKEEIKNAVISEMLNQTPSSEEEEE